MSDDEKNELIRKMKEGEIDFSEELFEEFIPLISRISQKYYLRDYDWEDTLQEARICFHKCAIHYDQSKMASFGYFFKRVLERKLCSLLRRQLAEKRKLLYDVVSLDDLSQEVMTSGEREHIFIDGYNSIAGFFLREELKEFYLQLSYLESTVLMAIIKGLDEHRTAMVLECEEEKVKNAVSRIKGKLKRYLK